MDSLAAIGRSLAGAGLTARALAAWAGTATLSQLPDPLPAARTPAAQLLALFVAGAPLSRARAFALLGDTAAACVDHGLLVDRGDQVVAPRALLPVGRASFLVCDPLDQPHPTAPTPWPDDSSYHLCGALGGVRAARWLDLGTGSGVAPLVAPQTAPLILGGELSARTARAAALGAALSGQRNATFVASDLDSAITGTWDLVSCNAPIPDEPGAGPGPRVPARASAWHRTDAAFLARLIDAVARRLAPGGLAVLHTALGPLLPVLAAAGGDAVCVVYTPPEHRAFAVTWWQPHLPARLRAVRRELTLARPHLDGDDRRAAEDPSAVPLPDLARS